MFIDDWKLSWEIWEVFGIRIGDYNKNQGFFLHNANLFELYIWFLWSLCIYFVSTLPLFNCINFLSYIIYMLDIQKKKYNFFIFRWTMAMAILMEGRLRCARAAGCGLWTSFICARLSGNGILPAWNVWSVVVS